MQLFIIRGIFPTVLLSWAGRTGQSGALLPTQRLLCCDKHRFCRAVCSTAVGVLGFYQRFLFLIRLFSVLKGRDLFMAQSGKPDQSLGGESCFGAEVQ